MSEIELKRCAYCGGVAHFSNSAYGKPHRTKGDGFVVNCMFCGMSTSFEKHTKEFAAEDWNKRVDDKQLTQTQARLEEAERHIEALIFGVEYYNRSHGSMNKFLEACIAVKDFLSASTGRNQNSEVE